MKVYISICKKLTAVTEEVIQKVKNLPNQYGKKPKKNVLFNLLSALDSIDNDNFFLIINGGGLYIREDSYYYDDEDCWTDVYLKMPEETSFTTNIDGLFGGVIWEASRRSGHVIDTIEKEKSFFEYIINGALENFQEDFKLIEKRYSEKRLITAILEKNNESVPECTD